MQALGNYNGVAPCTFFHLAVAVKKGRPISILVSMYVSRPGKSVSHYSMTHYFRYAWFLPESFTQSDSQQMEALHIGVGQNGQEHAQRVLGINPNLLRFQDASFGTDLASFVQEL